MKKKFHLMSRMIGCATIFMCFLTGSASANKITDSALGQGLINMFNDATGFLTLLAPVAGGLLIIYFLIRRKFAAEEPDAKVWEKKIKITAICTVGVFLTSGMLTLITSYFGGVA